MTDLEPILTLWRDLESSGSEYVLGTVIEVEGSGYRKPGARILIGADGRRAGTISGGCLEGDVARKAFWHTENGPVVRQYSTAADDGDVPYGVGCGGVVHLLLERRATAHALMARLAEAFAAREPLAVATVLEGERIALRAFWPPVEDELPTTLERLSRLAQRSFQEQRSASLRLEFEDETQAGVRVEWNAARPGLFVIGAGDDAIPLVRQARQLGWYVGVADGRSNLATEARFPEANEVRVVEKDAPFPFECEPTDATVVMTHSLEQDTRAIGMLLKRDLVYLGVLGPVQRTREMLMTLAEEAELSSLPAEQQAELWLERIQSPMGLDLGGETPADIALSVMAEIQLRRHNASGQSLKKLRAGSGAWPRMSAALR